MMSKFDQLIKDGKDPEAVFYLAEELYNSGKIGGTRKILLERIAQRVAVVEQRNKRICEATVKDIANRDDTIRALQERIDRLESENARLRKSKNTNVTQNGENNYHISSIKDLKL